MKWFFPFKKTFLKRIDDNNIIMQVLKQYEQSCISIGSLDIYYQFIVCAFTKYGAVHRASNKKSERFGNKFESLSTVCRNAFQNILSLYCSVIKGLPSYDLNTSITFVVLDCFTVKFLKVGLRNANMQSPSNRPRKSFMTFIAYA